MFIQRYISEGLAHYSYLIADQGEACVIDPRRDVDVYIMDALHGGYCINFVLETHRNEDYVSGSLELENAVGALVFHADGQLPYQYGKPVRDGQQWQVGRLKLNAFHTSGHTEGSMSYLLHDPDGNPWMIFSGDVLFSGDAGRVDLLGEDHLYEMAGMLYDSIFNKILPLGDEIILCPAHGAGSICGAGIAERSWTTLGLERRLNPKLQAKTKKGFIERHAAMISRPPYFDKIEALNIEGPPVIGKLPILHPMQPNSFETAALEAQVVDVRDHVSFGGGHLPGSISIWRERLVNFAGWFLNYDKPLLFICHPKDANALVRKMVRMGFDNLSGFLYDGVVGWSMAGKPLESFQMITADTFCQELKMGNAPFILDIRKHKEVKQHSLLHSYHIPLTKLIERVEGVPKDRRIAPLCSSGHRSMIAASLLSKLGWSNLVVLIGGLSAWNAFDCDYDL